MARIGMNLNLKNDLQPASNIPLDLLPMLLTQPVTQDHVAFTESVVLQGMDYFNEETKNF